MAKKKKKTNPILISLIQELKKQAYEKEAYIWKDIASRLERSSQNWPVVNLDKINENVKENETALIPGKVLSDGKLTKKIPVAAWSFSEKSKEKIKRAGGKVMTIQELVEKNPKGKDIRILG